MTPSIAFYAPLKSPNHATPSGDRTMARGLMNVLSELGNVELVSELRTRDGFGDADVQNDLIEQADEDVARLVKTGDWDAWVTYHNYYKAPDLIGPKVCVALNIPYHVIEASRSPKRLHGPWAAFAKLADEASDAADVIYYFTHRDQPFLQDAKPADQQLVHLKPFLDRDTIPVVEQSRGGGALLAVGMFRRGDKLKSYTNLANALTATARMDWNLKIVGAGEAEDEIRALYAPFGDRVTFLGGLSHDAVLQQMEQADVFVWPGVNEAFGMVYLEAQAMGTPVVAENRVGVRDVVGPMSLLVEPHNAVAYAQALELILSAKADAKPHQAYVAEHHLRRSAVDTIQQTMQLKARSS